MKILLLGGNGFIGKNINSVFIKSNFTIENASRATGCDMLDKKVLLQAIIKSDPDIIINCATQTGNLSYVNAYSADIVSANTMMYLNLYESIKVVNRNIFVINLISNCSYPDTENIQNERNYWNGKVHDSVESFGNMKKYSYVISRCFKTQYEISTLNLILPNAFGLYDSVDESRTHAITGIVIRMIKAQKAGNKTFPIWGSGTPIREWIFAEDVGRVILHILSNGFFDLPDLINIGQKKGYSIMESAELISRYLNYNVKLKNDYTKPDGAKIKILDSELFNMYCHDFEFTNYPFAIQKTINYYKTVL